MTLQKENQALRYEIAELKESLQKVSKDLSSKTKSDKLIRKKCHQIELIQLSLCLANMTSSICSKRKLISRFKISLLK